MESREELIGAARAGVPDALGKLLGCYENYLMMLARVQVGRRLQGKLDPADLVQDTFLEAHKNFGAFRGQSEPELTAWLRQILAARTANVVRHYVGTKGRDVRVERDLAVEIDQSSHMLDGALVAQLSSPSQQAVKREHAVILADALAALPADYRDAIVLRQLEGLSFGEVAERMARSEDSVQKLWVRGLTKLRETLRSLEVGG
jgi:RNA polymerase sigma-70 factor (ECF subfamily)